MKNLNLLISKTKSFQSHTEGESVIIFKSEDCTFEDTIKNLGFEQCLCKDQNTGRSFGTSQWFNETTKGSVFIGKNNTWTYAKNSAVAVEKTKDGHIVISLQE